MHVYTGVLIIGQRGDTLATQKNLFANVTPPNQGASTYALNVLRRFEQSDIQRIEMTAGVCPELSFAPISPQADGFVLAPNPAEDYASILFTAHLAVQQLAILDGTGRVVRKFHPNATSINTTGLKAGIYFLRLATDESTTTKKLIVK
ncbi:MAG: T9SS type A sorting domain-containing protein [Bacteroidota bacterium]